MISPVAGRAGVSHEHRQNGAVVLVEQAPHLHTHFAALVRVEFAARLELKLNWQSRIYEERERSLLFVCESPVILEQRAFFIAREIANALD